MKQVIALVGLVALLVLLVPSVAATPAKPTKAPTSSTMQEIAPSAQGVLSRDEAEKKPEYMLPYPGILPDHPLYIFKRLRDWILDRLIVDPLRKVEFYVLQADKRLNMGVVLIDKKKDVLGEEVISKGEKYFNNAIYTLLARKNEGKEVPTYLVEKLERSLEKHTEVLTALIAKTSGQIQQGLKGSLELVGTLQAELPKLK